MLKKNVQVGSTYRMNHSSGIVDVRILREKIKEIRGFGRNINAMGGRNMTHWIAINLKTGREIEIKSAAKLLRETSENLL